MMYEELTERLRTCGSSLSCNKCKWSPDCGGTGDVLRKAADAIEELSGLVGHYGGETGIKNLQEYASKYWDLLKNAPRWIPVTERYPEINRENSCSEYVVRLENGTYCIAEYVQDIHGKKFFECDRLLPNGASFGRVTHWMPLPEPQKEE